jgi:type VI secretion system protein ImpI
MTLRLVIEHAISAQPRSEYIYNGGDVSIGRDPGCDWQLEDPEMFISRRHCVVSGRDGVFTITDASRGGVFIDGGTTPLGAGNTKKLEHGTRLRLGEIVIRVEIRADETARPAPTSQQPKDFQADDFFSRPDPTPVTPPRPASLPEPYEQRRPYAESSEREMAKVAPVIFDDPFTLEPTVARAPMRTLSPFESQPAIQAAPASPAPALNDFSFDDFFSTPARAQPESQVQEPAAPLDESNAPLAEALQEPVFAPLQPELATAPIKLVEPVIPTPTPIPSPIEPVVSPIEAPRPVMANSELTDAFFKGLGLKPLPTDANHVAEMEALGRRFRLLVEGLVQMMRARSREKNSVRAAQTIIGSADVNPLKFLVNMDEVIEAIITPRGKGYLAPDDAITAAFRDLNDHQLRTWVALQSSLRAMIDRFDPAALESEVLEDGLLTSLLSGGKSAKLWQVYKDKYREIAKSAEDRFLGEVGADFRNAYEGNKGEPPN